MARALPRSVYLLIGAVLTHRWFHPAHRWLYRRTGGWGILSHGLGVPMILVTATGRRTGMPRTVPLGAVRDGTSFVLIGSYGGRDAAPGWVHNLRADGRATVEFRRDRWAVVAREAEGRDRDRLWGLVVAAYPGYGIYQSRTARRIPLFALTPEPPRAQEAPGVEAAGEASRHAAGASAPVARPEPEVAR